MSTSVETPSVVAPVVDPAAPTVEESKPVVTTEPTAPVVGSAEPATGEPAAETSATEPPTSDDAITDKPAPIEPAKPIESGVLGYKAPGLIK